MARIAPTSHEYDDLLLAIPSPTDHHLTTPLSATNRTGRRPSFGHTGRLYSVLVNDLKNVVPAFALRPELHTLTFEDHGVFVKYVAPLMFRSVP